MADTKKEHYVPRCYLENFEGEDSRIKVFDKAIMQVRSQLKGEIAAENYFYDIDFDKIMQNIDSSKHESIKNDIKKPSAVLYCGRLFLYLIGVKFPYFLKLRD